MHKEQEKRVSMREYYAYKLQIRASKKNLFLLGGRLLQQFVVDMYIKIETSRLFWFIRNQDKIRADLYKGIVDCIHAGEARADMVGRRTVLPASFIGGPRDMRRRYMDAMALVREYGKPDIFLTMTCNPNWDEIRSELLPAGSNTIRSSGPYSSYLQSQIGGSQGATIQKAYNRPSDCVDLCHRVSETRIATCPFPDHYETE